jgi:hypothetical protein
MARSLSELHRKRMNDVNETISQSEEVTNFLYALAKAETISQVNNSKH